MTMAADKQDKDQGKDFLNVPNKRVQSQTCLSPAERKGNVPVLRFPEFTGNWEKTKLADITKRVLRKNKGVVSERPLTISAQYGLIDQRDFFNKVVASENLEGYYLLKKGEFAYNKSYSNEYPWGAVKRLDSYDEGALSTLYICFECIGVDGDWLVHYFDSPKWNGQVSAIAVEGARNHGLLNVGIEDFFGTQHFVPNNKKEQKKIATFLNLIDERISTQIRIIDKLKSLMRGMNNELMDNPKWAKIYVGDFMEFFSTNSLSWEQLSYDNGQVHNLHYGLIHSGLPTLVDCQKESLPYIQDSSLPKQSTNCKDGDIAFADASEDTTEVGKVVELTNIGDKKIVCGLHTIHGRDVKDITVNGFKGFALNSKYFHDQLRRIAQGSKVYSINTDNVKSCYLYIPTVAEQQKIVGLLRCMQEKIEVAEYGLQLYKAQKQFLLRGLFV